MKVIALAHHNDTFESYIIFSRFTLVSCRFDNQIYKYFQSDYLTSLFEHILKVVKAYNVDTFSEHS